MVYTKGIFRVIRFCKLIKSGKRPELVLDLENRTGIKINRIEIGKIYFLRDVVMIKIYFYEDQQQAQMDDSFTAGNFWGGNF